MSETVVLDPRTVAVSRIALDITPWMAVTGVDWGDAAIEAFMADQLIGSSPVDYRLPNRLIRIPLNLQAVAGVSFATIREQLQAKTALIQAERGWIMRQIDTTPLYADVMSATLHLGGSWLASYRDIDVDAVLTLEALPDFYGDEIALSSHAGTNSSVVFTETNIAGNRPARARLVVSDTSGLHQKALLWGVRSRNYSPLTTSALAYEAELMTPMGGAFTESFVSRSGGSGLTVPTIPTYWMSVMSTDLLSGGPLTHVGNYRVWARMYGTGDSVSVRLLWGQLDFGSPTANEAVGLPRSSMWSLLDLGMVRLEGPGSAPHRWGAQIQMMSPPINNTGGAPAGVVDKVWLVPADEYSGTITAPTLTTSGFGARVGYDDFSTTADATVLNARTATLGGSWATQGPTGDFSKLLAAPYYTEQRTTTGVETGPRTAALGTTNYTDLDVAVTALVSPYPFNGPTQFAESSVYARYIDASNYAFASLHTIPIIGMVELRCGVRVAGTTTYLSGNRGPLVPLRSAGWLQVLLQVRASGQIIASAWSDGKLLAVSTFSHAALITGGALATGKPGFGDQSLAVGSVPARQYRGFVVNQPAADNSVVYANRKTEVRYNGVTRQDISGSVYGSGGLNLVGDLFRIPPSGLEGRTVEVVARVSRSDLNSVEDGGLDAFTAQIFYRPSYLFVA